MLRNKHRGVRGGLLIGLLVSLSLVTAPLAPAQPAYAAGPATPGATAPEDTTSPGDETVCAIEKMGWILCPVIETAGKVGDSMFQRLADWFLAVEPEVLNVEDDKGTKLAWNLALNLANILFIVAFIVIIYSQVTGAGISNYGIKRMLPRLIVAALLVNLSYYICQGMVDLSNILGYEIKTFMLQVAETISQQSAMPISDGKTMGIETATSSGTLGVIAMGALGLVGLVWMILPMLLLGIGTVVITVLIIIILLLMRKAFIILLVVVSPIAFVAYLLPNTERYFKKWLGMFWGLLMVFPVVSALFGGGQLASAVLLAAAKNDQTGVFSDTGKPGQQGEKCVKLPKTVIRNAEDAKAELGPCDADGTSLTLGLIAAGVAVAPLLAVWSVLQGALKAAGAIGGVVSGAVNKFTTSGVNKAGSMSEKRRERLKNQVQARALRGGFTGGVINAATLGSSRRRVRSDLRNQSAKSGLEAAQAGYQIRDRKASALAGQDGVNKAAVNASNIALSGRVRDDIAQGRVTSALGNAASAAPGMADAINAQIAKATAEAIRDTELSADFAPGALGAVGKAFTDAVKAGDSVKARAYQNMLLKSGGPGLKEYRESMRTLTADNSINSSETMSDIRRNLIDNHGNVKGAANDLMKQATSGLSMDAVSNAGDTWHMSDAELVAQKPDSLKLAFGAPGGISREQARRIIENNELSKHLSQDSLTSMQNRSNGVS